MAQQTLEVLTKKPDDFVLHNGEKYWFKCEVCRRKFEEDMVAAVAGWDKSDGVSKQYGLPPSARFTLVFEEHGTVHYVFCWDVYHYGLGGLPYSP